MSNNVTLTIIRIFRSRALAIAFFRSMTKTYDQRWKWGWNMFCRELCFFDNSRFITTEYCKTRISLWF